MKTVTDFYPFAVYAETKTSRGGKEYTSIGVCHKFKDKDGNNQKTYFNLIDKRDLLVLANACQKAFCDITFATSQERISGLGAKDEQVAQTDNQSDQNTFDDDIPF